jgi:hypothetical protein
MRLTRFSLDKLQHTWGNPENGYSRCAGCNKSVAVGGEPPEFSGLCEPASRTKDDGVIIRGPES